MNNFVIATNSDGRVQAFYVDEAKNVAHTWQIEAGNKLVWSQAEVLFGVAGGSREPLNGAVRVAATTDLRGQIQVVALTEAGEYFTCYQTGGVWNGWFKIEQQQ
ncbi:hypothetical protein [Kordia sp.]|uniref:hypothetical protein n=1 Tax=Kordia sp. TaxID=1965332 RepID=UPI0025BDD482|nr:hypothetical protein [Kordia sp.]MCH2194749.1 hypothetical protein [Kordia sp.]